MDAAYQVAQARGVSAVIACTVGYEADLAGLEGRGDTLMARLLAGNPPDWLVPVPVPGSETMLDLPGRRRRPLKKARSRRLTGHLDARGRLNSATHRCEIVEDIRKRRRAGYSTLLAASRMRRSLGKRGGTHGRILVICGVGRPGTHLFRRSGSTGGWRRSDRRRHTAGRRWGRPGRRPAGGRHPGGLCRSALVSAPVAAGPWLPSILAVIALVGAVGPRCPALSAGSGRRRPGRRGLAVGTAKGYQPFAGRADPPGRGCLGGGGLHRRRPLAEFDDPGCSRPCALKATSTSCRRLCRCPKTPVPADPDDDRSEEDPDGAVPKSRSSPPL